MQHISEYKERTMLKNGEERCENCRFWKGSEFDVTHRLHGECHKRPPEVYRDDPNKWPLTFFDEWCGAYQKENE